MDQYTTKTPFNSSSTERIRERPVFIGRAKVLQILEWKHKSIAQVARDFHYERSYFTKIFNGGYVPPLQLRQRIADYFDLPMEELWRHQK